LGCPALDKGQSRVPDPPAITTAVIILISYINVKNI
jgi:hypothetical protein